MDKLRATLDGGVLILPQDSDTCTSLAETCKPFGVTGQESRHLPFYGSAPRSFIEAPAREALARSMFCVRRKPRQPVWLFAQVLRVRSLLSQSLANAQALSDTDLSMVVGVELAGGSGWVGRNTRARGRPERDGRQDHHVRVCLDHRGRHSLNCLIHRQAYPS